MNGFGCLSCRIAAHLPLSAAINFVKRPLDKALWHTFRLAVNDKNARLAALHTVLGKSQCLEFAEPHKIIIRGGDDAKDLAQAVQEFQPRVIAVYGTTKIPDVVLKVAGQIALNMHTGISPYYRGTACAFWPIVENKADQVGATVHECTSATDGGAIFFSERAKLYRNDNLHTVFARAVKLGAHGYVDVLNALWTGQLVGKSQDLTIGHEYRGYMRGLRAEIKARSNLARMRTAWCVEDQDAPTGHE